MIRNLKALGLALVAVLAMGAVVGSATASAASFHSEKETTILTGTSVGNHVFSSGSLAVTCTHATFKGTSKGTGSAGNFTTSTLTLHPTYEGCSDNVFGGTDTVDTTGCNYVFNATTNGTGHLPSNIECTAGYSIKVTAPGCTLSFGEQNTTGGVKNTNESSGTTRDSKTVATVTATFTKSGELCFLVSGTSGLYSGTTTLKGYVDNGVTGNIDETEGAAPGKDTTATYSEGAQVGIWWE